MNYSSCDGIRYAPCQQDSSFAIFFPFHHHNKNVYLFFFFLTPLIPSCGSFSSILYTNRVLIMTFSRERCFMLSKFEVFFLRTYCQQNDFVKHFLILHSLTFLFSISKLQNSIGFRSIYLVLKLFHFFDFNIFPSV